MTRAQAIEILTLMRAAWPRQEVKAEMAEVYRMALSDMAYDDVKQAVVSLVRSSKWFPTVADIRERAVNANSPLMTPGEAWGQVREAIGRVGFYQRPVFESEEIQRAVDAIGWKEICSSENITADRARFLDAYRGFVERRRDREADGTYEPRQRVLPAPSPAGAFIEDGAPVAVESPREFKQRVKQIAEAPAASDDRTRGPRTIAELLGNRKAQQ